MCSINRTKYSDTTRMIDYPTPPRTQSPTASISGSSAPTTPSQGFELLDCPFASVLVDACSTPSPPYYPANAIVDWSMPLSMRRNPYEVVSRLDLLPTAPNAMSSTPRDTISFSTSPAVPPPGSMLRPSASNDFALAQHHIPVMLQDSIQREDCPRIKQEEEAESWFNDHIDLERSRSSLDFSSYGDLKSSRLSPSQVTSGRLLLSPGIGCAVASSTSGIQSQQFSSPLTARSESVESPTPLQRVPVNRPSVKGRRHNASSERRYSCSVCSRAFDKKYNLREHEKKHDPSSISPHVCPAPGCGKRLGRRTDVNRHFQSVHEKAKRFVCTKCLKRFDRKDTLSR